jgi:uncharacterized membrane protein
MKGFDHFVNSSYEEGIVYLREALESTGISVEHIPNHTAGTVFPTKVEELKSFDVVVLSDIGANTLLLHPDTFDHFKRTPNRLKVIADYVRGGGGFCMIGGYLTFQGIEGKGCWKGTLIEDILPVNLQDTDDRVETPEGVTPVVDNAEHPLLTGVEEPWPYFYGYNRLKIKKGADLVASVGDDAFLSAWNVEKGRSIAFASDCAPHWGSPAFIEWKSYSKLWANIMSWLAHQI